jgi:hypothetical protein
MKNQYKIRLAFLLVILMTVTSSSSALTQSEGRPWFERRLTYNAGDSGGPAVAISGSNIHVVWVDESPGNYEIYYKRSRDNGVTWGKTQRLTHTAEDSWGPAIAVSGSNVHVVWKDKTSRNHGIFYILSSDNGTTWGKKKCLTKNRHMWPSSPSIAVSGSNVHVTWQELSMGYNFEIFYRRSWDNGVTWSKTQHLSDSDTADDSRYPSISVSGFSIHAVWDNLDGFCKYEIYYRRSSESGITWGETKRLTFSDCSFLILNNHSDPYFFRVTYPDIVVSGSNVHVVWSLGNIYYKSSIDNGSTWRKSKRLTFNVGSSRHPAIAVLGSNIYLVWADGTPSNAEIFFKQSNDNGVTWTKTKRIINNASSSSFPDLAASENYIHVVWSDDTPGNNEIFYKRGR